MPRLLAALLLALALPATPGRPRTPPPRLVVEAARWSDGEAVAALRARLRARGYSAAVTAGPMVAAWDELAPASPVGTDPSLPRALRRDGPGAWLVVTE